LIHIVRYSLVLLAVLLSLTPTALAQDRTKEAAAKYESGMAHYHLAEWDAAIDDWQIGFRARPLPEFLYNIAQAYRLSKRPDRALQFYQSYLSMRPDAPNADDVRQHIADLKRELAEHPSAPTAPVASTSTPGPSTSSNAPSTEQPISAAAPTTPMSSQMVTATPPARKKRGWVWGVVAGGVVIVAGAVVLGVVLGTASNESRVPTVRF
jgi:tetratricopeptide (TPR) repeat protein